MKTVELKVNNYEDRKNLIIALVNSGYKVSVKEIETEKRVFFTCKDYYVSISEVGK